MKRPLRNRTMGVVRGGLAPAYSIAQHGTNLTGESPEGSW